MENETLTDVAPEIATQATEEVAPVVETIGNIIDQAAPEVKPLDTVGLDKFLNLKRENKAMRASIKVLESKINDGASDTDVTSDIEEIADTHNVDKAFLKKLASTIRAEAERSIDEKYSSRFKSFEDKDRSEKIDVAFNKHYGIAMENLPDFKDVVNPEVIKSLSLDPKNSHKTFGQIIEETYGHTLTGKRTIESTKSGGWKEPEPLNVERARKDSVYFAEVMASPSLKAEYNAAMLKKF